MKKQQPSLDHLSASEWRGRELSNAVVLFHEKIAAHLGLNSAEWKCLGLLDQHGPMTAGRLAELSRLTTGAITGVVDRLERAGYVRRERHPTDRRSVIVQPVKLGELKARVAPVFRSLGRAMGGLTSHYSQSEMAVIQDYLERVTKVLQQETAKL
jgi:DNA-binding MarR family transcriptional regulator